MFLTCFDIDVKLWSKSKSENNYFEVKKSVGDVMIALYDVTLHFPSLAGFGTLCMLESGRIWYGLLHFSILSSYINQTKEIPNFKHSSPASFGFRYLFWEKIATLAKTVTSVDLLGIATKVYIFRNFTCSHLLSCNILSLQRNPNRFFLGGKCAFSPIQKRDPERPHKME